jgi:UTP--glucose-1-phosphate uridylyltransferase
MGNQPGLNTPYRWPGRDLRDDRQRARISYHDCMHKPIRKAVIPAAGFGTRFLPFSKSVPKEMLPIVDRPVIEYIVAEAVAAGMDDILIITSRHKKVMEDHFDRFPELELALANKGKTAEVEQIVDLATHANIHFVRQGEALGLGHAIGMAEAHVGDEPFAVLLGDDIMHERAGVLTGMVDAYNRHGTSVVALMEVDPADISAYGCAATEPHADDRLFTVTGLVEKPAVADAPSNLAVMGRYLFTPAIFDEIRRTGPGVGGEIQITDAMLSLLGHETMLGFSFTEGRFDTGKKVDYLRAVVELTLERDDVGPAFREILADVCRREGLT